VAIRLAESEPKPGLRVLERSKGVRLPKLNTGSIPVSLFNRQPGALPGQQRSNKMKNFINTTPHPITFRNADGTEFTVAPCGFLLNATPKETDAGEKNGVRFVRTTFETEKKGLEWLEKQPADALIIGSIIAAQAYPGRVLALTPAKGFERVPVNEKRMNPDKFTIF